MFSFMKKLFTFALALMGFAGAANAETIDDVAVCKHSYVLVFDDWDNNGTAKPGKGKLFGNGFFLDVTGGTVATNKKSINLADSTFADGAYLKYAEYGEHKNSWRLKNGQDVIAMKVTAKSKIIILGQTHSSRYPMITDTAPASNKMQGTDLGSSVNTVSSNGVFEWVADDDRTIYIGSQGGDYYVSYLIVEAVEAPGTPTVKVGDQTYENGLWYREVTCKANDATEEGSTEAIPTVVYYTTDGSTPTTASTKYTEPIKCYKDMSVKFQAYMDLGLGEITEDDILDGAENEGIVSFAFDAPTITADGGNVTITSPYEGALNYVTLDGELDHADLMDSFTLPESATITAFSQIVNGDYATFTSKTVTADIYVLNPIKEAKKIEVTAGDVVLDEEATATSTTGEVYTITNGAISADKMDFFVKNLTLAVVKDAAYQAPDGNERYIKMSDTNITFQVAEGDSVAIKVTCSKNSCKTLNAENDESVTTDRKCYVNVNGTNYGSDDVTAENGNIIEFGVPAGTYTFKKYSGTGNILISSIEFTPVDMSAITSINADAKANGALYNVAGQKVSENYKGLVIKNGSKFMVK